jgi:hypothetical protein
MFMIGNIEIINSQIWECKKRRVEFVESPFYLMVGLAKDFDSQVLPVNGLRHPPEGVSTGWYIWSSENFPSEDDSFEPVHVIHLLDIIPGIVGYLGLPPGWRFLRTGEYEDVWTDEKLLDIEPFTNNHLFGYFMNNRDVLLGRE